jgi:hypothetical protein
MTNTPTEYNKLSGLEEILNLTKCKKKGAKTMNELLETSCQLCTDMDVYETDDNGDFVYIEKDDDFFPVEICKYLKVQLNIFQYQTNYLENKLFKQSINSSKSKSKGLNLVVEKITYISSKKSITFTDLMESSNTPTAYSIDSKRKRKTKLKLLS